MGRKGLFYGAYGTTLFPLFLSIPSNCVSDKNKSTDWTVLRAIHSNPQLHMENWTSIADGLDTNY
jgi:hypothetical protein